MKWIINSESSENQFNSQSESQIQQTDMSKENMPNALASVPLETTCIRWFEHRMQRWMHAYRCGMATHRDWQCPNTRLDACAFSSKFTVTSPTGPSVFQSRQHNVTRYFLICNIPPVWNLLSPSVLLREKVRVNEWMLMKIGLLSSFPKMDKKRPNFYTCCKSCSKLAVMKM